MARPARRNRPGTAGAVADRPSRRPPDPGLARRPWLRRAPAPQEPWNVPNRPAETSPRRLPTPPPRRGERCAGDRRAAGTAGCQRRGRRGPDRRGRTAPGPGRPRAGRARPAPGRPGTAAAGGEPGAGSRPTRQGRSGRAAARPARAAKASQGRQRPPWLTPELEGGCGPMSPEERRGVLPEDARRARRGRWRQWPARRRSARG